MKKFAAKIGFLASCMFVAVASFATNAAALDWTGITLDTTDIDSIMALVVVGLATLWGYRKVIKTMNRS